MECKDCLYRLEVDDEYICVNDESKNYNDCVEEEDSCPAFYFYEKGEEDVSS